MKTIALLISILSLTPFLHAQDADTWPKSGAVWKYCLTGDYPNFEVWSHTFAYTTDTVIGDHSYAMVQHTEVNDQPLLANGTSWIPEEDIRTYLRQSGDTIYRHISGQDYIFMVHGLGVGQDFSSFRSVFVNWNQRNCTAELPLQALSVTEPEYAGVTYRELILQDLDPYFNQENSNGNFYTFIEGIGLKHDFVYMTPEHPGTNGSNEAAQLSECLGGAYHLPSSNLYHYHDDNVAIDFFQCDISVSTSTIMQERNITVYPNPSQGHFTIQIDGAGQGLLAVQIFDLSGKAMLHQAQVSANQKIDISSISPGLYLLHARDERQSYIEKLVVQ